MRAAPFNFDSKLLFLVSVVIKITTRIRKETKTNPILKYTFLKNFFILLYSFGAHSKETRLISSMSARASPIPLATAVKGSSQYETGRLVSSLNL